MIKLEPSWQTTVTEQGLSILAGLDDNKVAIVGAWAGTGTVDPEKLQSQKELVNQKQKIPIIEDGKSGNKRVLRLHVSNSELDAGYTLNQLGIYVSVDGSPPILYFIAQNSDGDPIPSNKNVSDFLAEYVTTLIFSMRSDVVLEQPETVFVTSDALDARISLLMGIIPIDGGTFFEEYEPFTADGGDF